MNEIQSSNKLYIAESTIKNADRGVFTKELIAKGEIIENCPIIEVTLQDPANNDEGTLVDYFFYFGEGLAIALGFGSLYNHSYAPNATYKTNVKEKKIDFIAIENINPGDEITVNYNFGNPKDTTTPTVRGIPKYV